MVMKQITPRPTSTGPVVRVEYVAKAAGAVVAADVVVAVVVAGQLLVLPLCALVHICGADRASQSTNPCVTMTTRAHIHRAGSTGRSLCWEGHAFPHGPLLKDEQSPEVATLSN